MTGTTHICSKCGKRKPADAYNFRSKTSGVRHRTCRKCTAAYYAQYNRKVCPKTNESSRLRKRWTRVKTQFGITKDMYNEMVSRQGGRCAICKTDSPGRGDSFWHIDHCHESGIVRGLLCNRCNVGLGYFKDDADRLEAAADYIKRSGVR